MCGFAGFGVTFEQVGAVAVRAPYGFGRRVSGFAGLGVTLVQVGAGAVLGLPCLGSEDVTHGWPHPHPKLGIEVSQAKATRAGLAVVQIPRES